jgi:hypothetical protein
VMKGCATAHGQVLLFMPAGAGMASHDTTRRVG